MPQIYEFCLGMNLNEEKNVNELNRPGSSFYAAKYFNLFDDSLFLINYDKQAQNNERVSYFYLCLLQIDSTFPLEATQRCMNILNSYAYRQAGRQCVLQR